MENSIDVLAIFLLPVLGSIGLFIFRRYCDDDVKLNHSEYLADRSGIATWGCYAPPAPEEKIRVE